MSRFEDSDIPRDTVDSADTLFVLMNAKDALCFTWKVLHTQGRLPMTRTISNSPTLYGTLSLLLQQLENNRDRQRHEYRREQRVQRPYWLLRANWAPFLHITPPKLWRPRQIRWIPGLLQNRRDRSHLWLEHRRRRDPLRLRRQTNSPPFPSRHRTRNLSPPFPSNRRRGLWRRIPEPHQRRHIVSLPRAASRQDIVRHAHPL